ncbi:hypothetical protein Tco_1448026 [Tanacetum coccineum]
MLHRIPGSSLNPLQSSFIVGYSKRKKINTRYPSASGVIPGQAPIRECTRRCAAMGRGHGGSGMRGRRGRGMRRR